MVKRVVDTAFWTDMQVMDHYSVEDKYFSLYLSTNGMSTQVGIYALPKKVISFETGFTSDVIQVLLDRFSETYGKILYSEETQEITLLDSLEFSILKGGKPVSDLLERELSKVKDAQLIRATYEKMLDFWQQSKRKFDQTIQELFEKELSSRGLIQLQNESQSHNDNQIHNDSQNQNHNQESWVESEATNRGTNRQIIQKDENDTKMIERYTLYLKQLKPHLTKDLNAENIVNTFYEELIGDRTSHIQTTLNQWIRTYPTAFILEAILRSVDARVPLVYAAKILKQWAEAGATCHQDIIRLDKAHNKKSGEQDS